MPCGPSCRVCRYVVSMTPMCTDPAAYAKLADEFLECIMTRRHAWPPRRQQHPQHCRITFERTGASLELTEFYGDCQLCKTTRRLYRDRYDGSFMWAEYDYPDGYLAPSGMRWDPELIRAEYASRFPVKGRVKLISR